jgi:hypothetical protein
VVVPEAEKRFLPCAGGMTQLQEIYNFSEEMGHFDEAIPQQYTIMRSLAIIFLDSLNCLHVSFSK